MPLSLDRPEFFLINLAKAMHMFSDIEFRTPAQNNFTKARRDSSSCRSSRRESPSSSPGIRTPDIRTPDVGTPDLSTFDNDQLKDMLSKIQSQLNKR